MHFLVIHKISILRFLFSLLCVWCVCVSVASQNKFSTIFHVSYFSFLSLSHFRLPARKIWKKINNSHFYFFFVYLCVYFSLFIFPLISRICMHENWIYFGISEILFQSKTEKRRKEKQHPQRLVPFNLILPSFFPFYLFFNGFLFSRECEYKKLFFFQFFLFLIPVIFSYDFLMRLRCMRNVSQFSFKRWFFRILFFSFRCVWFDSKLLEIFFNEKTHIFHSVSKHRMCLRSISHYKY